jgi:hypothetical protein
MALFCYAVWNSAEAIEGKEWHRRYFGSYLSGQKA